MRRQAIANELQVKLAHQRIDPDIAQDALEALKKHVSVPPGIGTTVRDGYVTLNGSVEWMFQKLAAEKAVKYLRGVRGVFNHIDIKPRVSPQDVQNRITDALRRNADLEADASMSRRSVDASWRPEMCTRGAKWRAARAAWAAPGVVFVDNQITVVPAEPAILRHRHPCRDSR